MTTKQKDDARLVLYDLANAGEGLLALISDLGSERHQALVTALLAVKEAREQVAALLEADRPPA